jgi:hypothetical protein
MPVVASEGGLDVVNVPLVLLVSGSVRPVVKPCLPAASAAGHNRPVRTIDRPMPPLNADERTTLENWLDFHRTTLAMKCEGLDDEQAAVASARPSGLTLTGLVQHMAEVERNWFRRVLAAEQAPPIYDPQADPRGPDGGFELTEDSTLRDALAAAGPCYVLASAWCNASRTCVRPPGG